jgi:hypothetical protein
MGLTFSLLRLCEVVLYHPAAMSRKDIFLTLLTGFRFDMMVVGFWLSPIVAYLILSQIFFKKPIAHPKFVKIYFALSWILLCALYLKDLISFPTTHDRLWKTDHLAHPVINVSYLPNIEWWNWIMILILMLIVLKVGFSQFAHFTKLFQKIGAVSLVMIFLWTVLISRGTVTQHHLRRKDCQFAEDPRNASRIESLCLNPPFTYSKNK